MKKIAVLTSGGDAPGMNASIRAVVRTAIYYDFEPHGVRRGFLGLMESDFEKMGLGSVATIIHRGGTILYTARCDQFKEERGQKAAYHNLLKEGIEGLIVIGGDGSLRGAYELERLGLPVIVIPATIDNDIYGTDLSIGFDTAVNTVVGAINKIRDTAASHERIFIIEVMGRYSGAIALNAGLAGGAESILVPELPVDYQPIIQKIKRGIKRGKKHSIIIVAEGAASALEVAKEITRLSGLDVRTTVLGHVQRGGTPSALDIKIASRMGSQAVELLKMGASGLMIGIQGNQLITTSFREVVNNKKAIEEDIGILASILSI